MGMHISLMTFQILFIITLKCTLITFKHYKVLIIFILHNLLTLISWDFLGFPGISWDFLGFLGISWDFLGFPGISWDSLGFPGTSWDFLAFPGISWDFPCTIFYKCVSWDFLGFPGISPCAIFYFNFDF